MKIIIKNNNYHQYYYDDVDASSCFRKLKVLIREIFDKNHFNASSCNPITGMHDRQKI